MRPVVLLVALTLGLAGLARGLPAGSQDSLRTALARAGHDTVQVKLLLAIAGEVLSDDPDSAMALCLRALPIAARTGLPGYTGEVEGWLGYLEEQRGRIPAAIDHYQRSLAAAEAANDRKGVGTILNNLAAIYKDQGRVEESVALHERSLALKEEIGDTLGIATSLNNIGLIRFDQGRIAEALELYDRSLRLYEGVGDQEGVATVLHNIAGVYTEQGQHAEALRYLKRALVICERRQDRYASAYTLDNIGTVLEATGRRAEALKTYKEALALRQAVDDVRGMGYSYRNIGNIHLAQDLPEQALPEFLQSLDQFTRSEDKRGQATSLLKIARAEEMLGRPANAFTRAEQAMALGVGLGNVTVQRDAAEQLARLHGNAGRWQQAFRMRETYHAMRDSVQSAENRRRSMRQEFQYAYDLKEAGLRAEQERRDLLAREQLQKERNRRNILLFSGLGVLVFAIGLWSRLRFVRRSRSAIQRERDRSEELLLNILPQAVAEELKAKGAAEAKQIDQVTVLFTDFKGFTAMSEALSPQEIVRDLNECFSAFDRLTEQFGIEKIKTIGDAYMAAGGLPTPNATHAADVVGAALAMRDLIAESKARRIAAGLPYFEIRIGIHTGPVVAGIVGLKKFSYDIWGDTVNTASRMESSGVPGHVNISEATYLLVKDLPGLTFTSRGKVQAKGKGEMEMYFVEPEGYAPMGA